MANEIISYLEMYQREGLALQRGMNFGVGKTHSVILMSRRANAPYRDRIEDDGSTLIYEGHDVPRTAANFNPKLVDQPEKSRTGRLTENGKFHKAAVDYKRKLRAPENDRVYEKIHAGIWSYNGLFHLVDSWQERDKHRKVFKYKLVSVEDSSKSAQGPVVVQERRRIIPSEVKLKVWKRDGGKCRICGATDELHFDHIIPFSKGGTSLKEDNVQLLCARHNLEKRDKIL